MNHILATRPVNAAAILYTVDVAQMLGVTVHTLHKLADVGRAPAPLRRVGSRNIYLRSDVEAFIDERTAGKLSTGPCRARDCGGAGTVARGGLCPRHRHAHEVLGDLALRLPLPVVRRGATLAEKIAAFTIDDPASGCRIWIGARTSDGYSTVQDPEGRTLSAHRAAFELAMGRPVADGFEPDHECEQRACVRVGDGHVAEATHQQNMDRMAASALARRAAVVELPVVEVLPVAA